jgi:hypothetical protein
VLSADVVVAQLASLQDVAVQVENLKKQRLETMKCMPDLSGLYRG